jgi:hypothetical protein
MQMDKVLESRPGLLRNHPQMSYKKCSELASQVDLARRLRRQTPKRRSRNSENGVVEESSYMGCWLFHDEIFCGQINDC